MPLLSVYNLALHGQGDCEMVALSGAGKFGKASRSAFHGEMEHALASEAELAVEITHHYSSADIESKQLDLLMDMVRWRTVPRFRIPGRTAWCELANSARFRNRPNVEYRAAKIKGIGLWNPAGYLHSGVQQGQRSEQAIRPTSIEYEPLTRLRHFGIAKDGEFFDVGSNPTPYGGILHQRAVLEYSNAARLLEHGVPSIGPLIVIRYPELRFRDQPMGAVITLSTEQLPYRAHVDYIGEYGEAAKSYYLRLYEVLGIDGDPQDPFVQWQAFRSVCQQIGGLIRGFAESGLYRYGAHLENLHFDIDRGELFLTDLDSSLRLDELPADVQPLQVLRDVASALHKIALRLHYFVTLDRFSIAQIRSVDPFAAFLRGYFPEPAAELINRAVEPFWLAAIPHLFLRKRLRNVMGTWDRERLRTYEVDRDVFYCLAMIKVFDFFAASSLGRRLLSGLTEDGIKQRALRFLGPERFDYMTWLEQSRCDGPDPAAGTGKSNI
jgi:hypothetical protein